MRASPSSSRRTRNRWPASVPRFPSRTRGPEHQHLRHGWLQRPRASRRPRFRRGKIRRGRKPQRSRSDNHRCHRRRDRRCRRARRATGRAPTGARGSQRASPAMCLALVLLCCFLAPLGRSVVNVQTIGHPARFAPPFDRAARLDVRLSFEGPRRSADTAARSHDRTPSIVRRCLRRRVQGPRCGGRDSGVGLLARAGNTYSAHDFAGYAYRHAAAKCRDVGGDECRSAPIDVVLDLLRRPLQPRSRSRLPDSEVRACRADAVHPQERKQIPGRINHCDCRGCILLLRALSCRSQDRLGSGLIENSSRRWSVPSLTDRRPLLIFQQQFQVLSWRSDFVPLKFGGARRIPSQRACVTRPMERLWCEPDSSRSLWRRRG